ncbi:hypothetical protein Xvtf_19665 [Xanthomonas campestris pv. vitistrifoliae]|nr:hypothetical protein Xvtf_19665 [Xanthomonas campestris pv. vitistrifoliae]
MLRLASFLRSKLKTKAALRVRLIGEFLIEELVEFMRAFLRVIRCEECLRGDIGRIVRVVPPPRWRRSTLCNKNLNEPKVVIRIELGSSTDILDSHIKQQHLVYELRSHRRER